MDNKTLFILEFKPTGSDKVVKSFRFVANSMQEAQNKAKKLASFNNRTLAPSFRHGVAIARASMTELVNKHKELGRANANLKQQLGRKVKISLGQDDFGKYSKAHVKSNINKRASGSSMTSTHLFEATRKKITAEHKRTLAKITSNFRGIDVNTIRQVNGIKKALNQHFITTLRRLNKQYSSGILNKTSAGATAGRYKSGKFGMNGQTVSGAGGAEKGAGSYANSVKQKQELLANKASQLQTTQLRSITKLKQVFEAMGLNTNILKEAEQKMKSSLNTFKAINSRYITDQNTTVSEYSRKLKAGAESVKAKIDNNATVAKKAINAEKTKRNETSRTVIRNEREKANAVKQEENLRSSLKYRTRALVSKRISALKMESENQTKAQRRASKIQIKKYREMGANLEKQIRQTQPVVGKSLKNFFRELDEKVKKQMSGLDVQTHNKVAGSKGFLNSDAMKTGMAGAGALTIEAGRKMEGAIKSIPYDRIGNVFTDLMQSTLYTSWIMIFTEMTKIIGNLANLFVRAVTIPLKMSLMLIAGIIQGIGISLLKGVIMATLKIATGTLFTAGTALASAGVTLLITAGYAMFVVLKGIMSTISEIISVALDTIMSVIKMGIMIIVQTVKAIGKAIAGIVIGIFTSIKRAFTSMVSFAQESMKSIVKIGKVGVGEFAKEQLLAAQSFKETIGVAGQTLGQYQGLIRKLRSTFGVDLADVGAGVYDVVSSGYRSISEATRIATASAKLAIAAESTLATSVRAVVVAFRNYSKYGETVKSITNTLATATTLGAMNMEELGNSMKNVMGISARAGVSFKNTMLSLAYLTRTFGRGSVQSASRYFSRFIEAITMPASKARKELVGLGVTFNEMDKENNPFKNMVKLSKQISHLKLEDVRKVFTRIQDRRAWLGLTADIKNFGTVFRDAAKMGNNVMQKQFDIVNATASRVFARIKQSAMVVFSVIGQFIWSALGGAVTKFSKMFTKIIDTLSSKNFSSFMTGFKEWFAPVSDTLFSGLLKNFDNLRIVIKKLFRGGNLKDFFKSEAVVKFRKQILNLVDGLSKIGGYLWDISKFTFNQLTKEGSAFNTVLGWIKGKVKEIVGAIEKNSLEDWIQKLEDIKVKILAIKDTILDVFGDKVLLSEMVSDIWDSFKDYAYTAFLYIKSFAINIFYQLASIFGSTLKRQMLEAVIAFTDAIVEAFKGSNAVFRTMIGYEHFKNYGNSAKDKLYGKSKTGGSEQTYNEWKSDRSMGWKKLSLEETFDKSKRKPFKTKGRIDEEVKDKTSLYNQMSDLPSGSKELYKGMAKTLGKFIYKRQIFNDAIGENETRSDTVDVAGAYGSYFKVLDKYKEAKDRKKNFDEAYNNKEEALKIYNESKKTPEDRKKLDDVNDIYNVIAKDFGDKLKTEDIEHDLNKTMIAVDRVVTILSEIMKTGGKSGGIEENGKTIRFSKSEKNKQLIAVFKELTKFLDRDKNAKFVEQTERIRKSKVKIAKEFAGRQLDKSNERATVRSKRYWTKDGDGIVGKKHKGYVGQEQERVEKDRKARKDRNEVPPASTKSADTSAIKKKKYKILEQGKNESWKAFVKRKEAQKKELAQNAKDIKDKNNMPVAKEELYAKGNKYSNADKVYEKYMEGDIPKEAEKNKAWWAKEAELVEAREKAKQEMIKANKRFKRLGGKGLKHSNLLEKNEDEKKKKWEEKRKTMKRKQFESSDSWNNRLDIAKADIERSVDYGNFSEQEQARESDVKGESEHRTNKQAIIKAKADKERAEKNKKEVDSTDLSVKALMLILEQLRITNKSARAKWETYKTSKDGSIVVKVETVNIHGKKTVKEYTFDGKSHSSIPVPAGG